MLFDRDTPQMDTDTLDRLLAGRRIVEEVNARALERAYRQHEEVEEALNNAVAHLAGVADSQELADDLLELEELVAQIWDHLFVDSRSGELDRMTMRVG